MFPINQLTTGVLAEIIRRQPPSAARTSFAWQIVVGPALARTTTVALHEGVLTVRAADARWMVEVTRAREVVIQRLQHLLGPNSVTTLRIER